MADTVLLMGLPNVGKSVIFNRLTGLNVHVANYVGTTVQLSSGRLRLDSRDFALVDVPGTYSLNASCEAEEVAVDILRCGTSRARSKTTGRGDGRGHDEASSDRPAAILFVVDATNLESSLYLLFQVLQYNIPVVVSLNRSDLSREKGYQIDAGRLSRELGVPVVPTVAVTGEGMGDLKTVLLQQAAASSGSSIQADSPVTWDRVEEVCLRVCTRVPHHSESRRARWGMMLTRPWPGLPLCGAIIGLVLLVVVGVGMGLRQFVLLPVFRTFLFPPLENLVNQTIPAGLLQNILIGEYGFLIKGIEWPFALVLPYIISFYIAMSVLEDSGYMPRLAVLLDGLFNRVGLKGSGIIPLMLGYGCAIPAILATRALQSKKERLIVTTMVCVAVPCISQTGAFIALLSARSIVVMLAVFLLGAVAMIAVAIVLNRFMPGNPPATLMEIPDLLIPQPDVLLKKVWVRIRLFVTDGALPMIIGVAIAASLYETGLMSALGELARPLVVSWLGLPTDAAVPLVLGILRRELAVLPLMEMDLTTLQLFVGAAVALFYVPCIAVIATLAREFNIRLAVMILIVTTVGAFLVGGIILRIGQLLM